MQQNSPQTLATKFQFHDQFQMLQSAAEMDEAGHS